MLPMLLQAVAGPPAPTAPKPRELAACSRDAAPGEIVVCARGQEQFRLRPLSPRAGADDPALPKAQVEVAPGVSLAAEAEQGNVGNIPTNRALMRLKLRF